MNWDFAARRVAKHFRTLSLPRLCEGPRVAVQSTSVVSCLCTSFRGDPRFHWRWPRAAPLSRGASEAIGTLFLYLTTVSTLFFGCGSGPVFFPRSFAWFPCRMSLEFAHSQVARPRRLRSGASVRLCQAVFSIMAHGGVASWLGGYSVWRIVTPGATLIYERWIVNPL